MLAPVCRESFEIAHQLTAISTPSPAAGVLLSGSEAVLAIHGPVASWLKRHCGLLPARGTCNRCALRFAPRIIPATTGLLVLLYLATRLAAFRSRVAAFLKKRLILAGERELLSAVATGQLQILYHKALSSTLSLYAISHGCSLNGQII